MKLGIALSGGGIRGIAHAGVLKALEDNNIKIDIIGGCSSGSIIAAFYAMGYSPYYIYIMFKRYAKKISKVNVKPFITGITGYLMNKRNGITGLRNGEDMEILFNKEALKKNIENIEQIKMPLVIPAVDITESKEYVFTNIIPKNIINKSQYITNISIGKVLRASSSFPAVFNTCNYGKHAFLDGGILDNIPVNEVKKQGADKVIAVKFDADKVDRKSNIMDVIMKTIDIMGNKISEESLEMSDLILNVYTDKVGLLDVDKLDKCYKYGYECGIKNIDKIKQMLNY